MIQVTGIRHECHQGIAVTNVPWHILDRSPGLVENKRWLRHDCARTFKLTAIKPNLGSVIIMIVIVVVVARGDGARIRTQIKGIVVVDETSRLSSGHGGDKAF